MSISFVKYCPKSSLTCSAIKHFILMYVIFLIKLCTIKCLSFYCNPVFWQRIPLSSQNSLMRIPLSSQNSLTEDSFSSLNLLTENSSFISELADKEFPFHLWTPWQRIPLSSLNSLTENSLSSLTFLACSKWMIARKATKPKYKRDCFRCKYGYKYDI